jgi:hypothetical protein
MQFSDAVMHIILIITHFHFIKFFQYNLRDLSSLLLLIYKKHFAGVHMVYILTKCRLPVCNSSSVIDIKSKAKHRSCKAAKQKWHIF